MRKLALLGIMILAPLTAAHADIIPTNGIINGSGPVYTWDYTAQVTSDQTAFSGPAPASSPAPIVQGGGAFFTLYDFAGYIAGSCVAPTGWTCSAQNVGFTPNGVTPVAPPDDPNVINITFVYTSGPALVGPQEVTGFSLQTTSNETGRGSFAARAVKNSGAAAGTVVDNVGNVDIPVFRSTGVPEPTSLALMGAALIGLGASRRKRQRV